MKRRRIGRALRRRYGHADTRRMWRMFYRGENFGHIAAHDREEALAIALDTASPRWTKNLIEVGAV